MKFNTVKTKDGKLTRYGFYCGYQEIKEIDSENYIRMVLEPNGFHIKGRINGNPVWEILENPIEGFFPIKEARKIFNNFFKTYEHKYK